MTEYDQMRKDELSEKIKEFNIKELPSIDVETIVQFENELTKNKDMVVSLNEQGIVGNVELQEKLSGCFNLFLQKIVDKFGSEFCQKIYDYEPGEELEFLNGLGRSQLENNALEVTSVSLKLKESMGKYYKEKGDEDYRPMLSMIETVTDSSSRLLKGINEKQELIAELGKNVSSDINIFNESIIPYFSNESKTNLPGEAAFRTLRKSIKSVKSGLEATSNSIKKL